MEISIEVVVYIFLPAGRAQSKWPAGPRIGLRFLRHFVGLLVCASPLIMCAIVMLRTLLPCDFTVDFGSYLV